MKLLNVGSILVFCTYMFLCAPLESSASSKEIRVGVYDNKPMIFMSESGPQGIYIDVLEHIAKAEGWNLQYHQGTWNDVFTLLTRNEIDILPVVAFIESRLAQLDFCEQTLISNWGQVYVRKNLSMESIQNLEGKKIATLSQDTHGDYFKTLLAQLGISYETVLIENYPELFQALESGKTDAAVVNYLAVRNATEKYDIQSTPIVFNPIQIRYAVPKGDPTDILAAIDRHITNFKSDKNSVYHTSMAYWFGVESPSFQFPGWIKGIFIILSGVFVVLVTGNIVLRIQVKAKTKALLIELKNRELAEKGLRKSESLSRKMVANIADVIVIIDQNGINKYKSPNIEKLFGWKPEEVVGASTFDNVHPSDLEPAQRFFKKLMQKPHAAGMIECRYRCKNGSFKWIAFTGINLFHDSDIQGLLGNYHDITKRKQAEDLVRASKERFRRLFAHNSATMLMIDPKTGDIIEANRAAANFYGWSVAELKQMRIQQINTLVPEDVEKLMQKTRSSGSLRLEFRHSTANGTIRDVEVFSSRIEISDKDFLYSIIHDISERKQVEEALKDSLAEKEVLLREVHHRVKNNMAAIIGLFNLQRQEMDDPQTLTVMADLSSRVKAMSLVHEKLYQSKSLAKIDFQDYIQSLISHLRTSFGSPGIKCDIQATGVEMPLDLAVPCGMIINELVINALKYAFPKKEPTPGKGGDRIGVVMSHDDGSFVLSIADNGVGLPAGFDLNTAKSLGLVLVRMLGQHQLGGRYEVDRRNGTRFTLTFSLRKRKTENG